MRSSFHQWLQLRTVGLAGFPCVVHWMHPGYAKLPTERPALRTMEKCAKQPFILAQSIAFQAAGEFSLLINCIVALVMA